MKAEPLPRSSATTRPATRTAGRDDSPAEDRADALPTGTRLGEFELLGVLGCGGFGIVYLARDHTLLRNVAVKEYLPVDFARRSENRRVVPRTTSSASTFATGLQSFIKEAQLLAGFDHPSLVKVHRFWEANGTAYMVMPHYPGCTLKEVQRTQGAVADERWLRRLLEPMLAALEVLHDANVYHRDISPDNIILLPDGVPVLLDFGSARRVLGDRTQALTAMLKPNFAAIEQYGDVPGMRQGAWTDLYALGGVVHFMITGAAPTPAAMRAVQDCMPALASTAAGTPEVSLSFLRAIDWALEVDPARRPQSVNAFRDALDAVVSPPAPVRRRYGADEQQGLLPTVRTAGPTVDLVFEVATLSSPGRNTQSRLVRFADRQPARRLLAGSAISAVLASGIWALNAWSGSYRSSDTLPSVSHSVPPRSAVQSASDSQPAATAAALLAAPAPASPREAPVESRSGAVRASASSAVEAPAAARKVATPTAPRPSVAAARPAHTVASSRAGPREVCGDRNFLSMAVCMDRQCRQPDYRLHAECEEYRRYAEARTQSEGNR